MTYSITSKYEVTLGFSPPATTPLVASLNPVQFHLAFVRSPKSVPFPVDANVTNSILSFTPDGSLYPRALNHLVLDENEAATLVATFALPKSVAFPVVSMLTNCMTSSEETFPE